MILPCPPFMNVCIQNIKHICVSNIPVVSVYMVFGYFDTYYLMPISQFLTLISIYVYFDRICTANKRLMAIYKRLRMFYACTMHTCLCMWVYRNHASLCGKTCSVWELMRLSVCLHFGVEDSYINISGL